LAGLQEINTEDAVRLLSSRTMRVPEIWLLQMIEPQGGVSEEMQVRKDVSGRKRMQMEQKTCLRGMQRERLGDGRVDGVEHSQHEDVFHVRTAHTSLCNE
jgi:hypothetical protein